MNVTIGLNQDGAVTVHKTGCQAAEREHYQSRWTAEVTSQLEAATDAYCDQIGGGEMTEADALDDVRFHACTKGLVR